MILLDEEVYDKLRVNVNLGQINVVQGYPTEYYDLPLISYICETNNVARKTDGREVTTYLVYKVDLFCIDDDENIEFYCSDIDDAMSSLGMKRIQYTMIQEPNGVHIVFRYSVYIDETGYAWDSCF